MKVLILGGTGMLGYGVTKAFLESDIKNYDLYVSAQPRSHAVVTENQDHFDKVKVMMFHAFSHNLSDILTRTDGPPNYIINCIGVIKPFMDNNRYSSLYVNSAFPHLLSSWAATQNIKVIHITTDCVFSGEKGRYTEEDTHDEVDTYGRSKSLGEPDDCMVLRTSIVGPEIHKQASLIAWAQSQKGQEVKGYTNHLWNGITTKEYGNVCKHIIDKGLYEHKNYHIFSPSPLPKIQLLHAISNKYDLNLRVEPHQAEAPCDRTLASIYPFCESAGIKPFAEQLAEL
jgi:dTDP-4-dehydrorhamnose reductase